MVWGSDMASTHSRGEEGSAAYGKFKGLAYPSHLLISSQCEIWWVYTQRHLQNVVDLGDLYDAEQ